MKNCHISLKCSLGADQTANEMRLATFVSSASLGFRSREMKRLRCSHLLSFIHLFSLDDSIRATSTKKATNKGASKGRRSQLLRVLQRVGQRHQEKKKGQEETAGKLDKNTKIWPPFFANRSAACAPVSVNALHCRSAPVARFAAWRVKIAFTSLPRRLRRTL